MPLAPTVEDEGRLKNILLQKSQIQTTILLKEPVEFPEPSFRMNFAESPLEVASETDFPTSRWKLLHNSTFQFRTQKFASERTERERESFSRFGVSEKKKPERYL